MKQLIRHLIEKGCLKDLNLIEAFAAIDRADFVPQYLKDQAYEDRPLPIGFGQTISQPAVVAFMLELLEPRQGEKIMDVGSGSGWQTALLAHLTGEQGKVVAVERILELYEFGKENCKKYGFKNIEFLQEDATTVNRGESYFDKIIAGASSSYSVPENFRRQLKTGGKMVVPIRESIFSFTKNETGFTKEEFPGFVFVPLIQD